MRRYLCTMILLSMFGGAAFAEEEGVAELSVEEKPEAEAVTTQHSVRIDGKTIRYTATAGLALINNDQDEPNGLFGYTAYIRDGVEDTSKRPILFAYNGGPGSASIWLHMGVLGPRRIPVVDRSRTS